MIKIIEVKKSEFKSNLKVCILNYITKIVENGLNEKIYGFVLFCDSGFNSFDISFSTLESLSRVDKKGFDSSDSYYVVCSHTWEYIGKYFELFEAFDKSANELRNICYKNDYLESDIENEISELIISVFLDLKKENVFKNSIFYSDVLLGLQFPDPVEDDKQLIRKVSSKLNTKFWHEKVLQQY